METDTSPLPDPADAPGPSFDAPGDGWLDAWNALPLPVAVQDEDFRIVHVNPAFESAFGFPLAELRGQDAKRVTHPEDHAELLARRVHIQALRPGESLVGERRARHRDGHVLIHRIRTTKVADARGRMHYLTATESIAQARGRDRQWLAGSDWHHLLFDHSPTPQVLLDQSGRIVEVNDAFTEYMDRAAEDVTGHPLAEFLDTASGQDMRHLMRSPLWQTRRVMKGYLRRAARPDGTEVVFNTIARETVAFDGTPVRLVTLVDVTREQEARRQLEAALGRQRVLLAALDSGAALLRDGVVVEHNAALTRLLGSGIHRGAEGTGLRLVDLDPRLATLGDRFPEGEAAAVEIERARPDGGRLVLLCEVRCVGSIGRDRLLTVRDVSAQRDQEARRVAEAAQRRDALVRQVHHHLGNGLTGAVGLLRLEARRTPAAAEALERSIARLGALIEVFGLRQRGADTTLLVGDLLAGLCAQMGRAYADAHAGRSPFALVADAAASARRVSATEQLPLALVLTELLTNALKHREHAPVPEGGVPPRGEVLVSLQPNDAMGACIEIRSPGRLPEGFELSRFADARSGMGLVRAMLPPRGIGFTIGARDGQVCARLRLAAPVLED